MYVYVVKCDVFSLVCRVRLCVCVCVYVVKCDVFSLVCRATRTIYAEGRARIAPVALSPAFRALHAHDLRRGLRGHGPNRALACISRTPHARSPQRVAREQVQSHSRLHFAHTTRMISAEGCAHTGQIALSPAFRARDTHDLRRGLRGNAHSTRTISAEGCPTSTNLRLRALHFGGDVAPTRSKSFIALEAEK